MDLISLIKSPIRQELLAFDARYDATLTSDNALLNSVIDHLRKSRGKMMRPILVLLSAKLCGTVNETTYCAAVALELLHTASLIHDDVVDESEERRGQASVESAFNNKTAVLSGDYVLASALTQVAETRHIGIVELLARLGKRLAEGELLQLSLHRLADYNETVYMDIIDRKTASLFAACTQAGALSASAPDEMGKSLCRFGLSLGKCFQIRDDIFDYFANPQIGKPTGKDMAEGKLTLPVLYALDRTADDSARAAADRVAGGTATTDDITRLTALAIEGGGIDYAYSVMETLRNNAIESLDTFADSPVKTALIAYMDYVIGRDK